MNNSSSPIFVTGVQRSGATIVAKILAMSGAFTGKVTPMQENIDIKNLVLDEFYFNVDRKAQYPFPDIEKLMLHQISWRKDITNVLKNQGYTDDLKWMFKSSTTCHIWPIWHFNYPNAKWIIVRRRTGDIVQSCMKTAYMTAFKNKSIQNQIGVTSEQEGWLWWVNQHEKLFVKMLENGLNCKVIWPERMVNGDYVQICEMLEWVGLKWDDSIISTIDSLLCKSKQKEREDNG